MFWECHFDGKVTPNTTPPPAAPRSPPARYEILRGMGIMWNEPLLVDWREEEEHLVYPWREWGVRKDDEYDDEGGLLSTQLDPEFGLDGGSLL